MLHTRDIRRFNPLFLFAVTSFVLLVALCLPSFFHYPRCVPVNVTRPRGSAGHWLLRWRRTPRSSVDTCWDAWASVWAFKYKHSTLRKETGQSGVCGGQNGVCGGQPLRSPRLEKLERWVWKWLDENIVLDSYREQLSFAVTKPHYAVWELEAV